MIRIGQKWMSRRHIRKWINANDIYIICDLMGFNSYDHFLRESGGRSFREFRDDFLEEGMCWKEALPCSTEDLEHAITNYAMYWF